MAIIRMTCYDPNLWFNGLIKTKKNSLWIFRSNNSFYRAMEEDYLFRRGRLSPMSEEKILNLEESIIVFISKRK